jgi:hypothetical protein
MSSSATIARPRPHGEAEVSRLRPRLPAPPGPWLSRRDWRRALALYVEGRLSRSEFEQMKERLARVRTGASGERPRAGHPHPVLRDFRGSPPRERGAGDRSSPRSSPVWSRALRATRDWATALASGA